MTYPAVTDRRIPYHADGTVVAQGSNDYAGGITGYPSGTGVNNLNDQVDHGSIFDSANSGNNIVLWFFFPGEKRIVTGIWALLEGSGGFGDTAHFLDIQGSNDTTNGIDGTWETASVPGGFPVYNDSGVDAWRAHIKAISFTGSKKVVRMRIACNIMAQYHLVHLYGHKDAGETPDDLVFIDSDDGGGTSEFSAVEDFGDRPLGTTVVRQFKVKNTSATLTASSITLTCSDADWSISFDGVTYSSTLAISSLGPGVSSAVIYVKNTTPAPGASLKPRATPVLLSGYTFA